MVNISTDFDSGNIGAWHLAGPRELHFHAPLDSGMYAMWFYFRVENTYPGPFDFMITNLHECLEPQDWVYTRLVYRPEREDWRRVETPPEVNLANKTFRFRIDLPDKPVEIAFCYPYTPQDLQVLLDNLATHERVEITYPVKSDAGRPVPYIRMSCLGDEPQPKTIWAVSREHAGEVSGAYTLDGFLRALVNSRLRQRFEIHSLPMMALDAVVEGRYGKVVPPADYWEGWFSGTPRPEIRFVMEQIAACANEGRHPQFFLTFHSPSAENDSYMVVPNPTLLAPDQRNNICKLAHFLKQETGLTANEATSAKSLGWRVSEGEEVSGPGWISTCYDADGCTIEASYNAMPDGVMGSPERWREYGAGIVRAVERYLLDQDDWMIDVYGTLPSVMTENEGWIIWQLPQGCWVELNSTGAHFTAWSEAASAFFGAPDKYLVHDMPNVTVTFLPTFDTTYHNGGVARVVWLPYDVRGWRLFSPPAETTVSPGLTQKLTPPPVQDSRIAYVRPSFHLSGAFGEFIVRISCHATAKNS